MDRISTLRNVEDALRQFEDGELTLPELEQQVRGVLRTYATEFQEASKYHVSGDDAVDGLVIIARTRREAREKVADLVPESGSFDVERIE